MDAVAERRDREPIAATEPATPRWPLAAVGFGVLLSVGWSAFLGWSLYQLVQWLSG